MSIFDEINNAVNKITSRVVGEGENAPLGIYTPGTPAAKALESSAALGEALRQGVGQKLVSIADVFPQTTLDFFANISRFAGGALKERGIPTPKPGATTITEALSQQPFFGEQVQKEIEKTPLGKVPFLAPVAGFLSEMLLPPYFGKPASLFSDLAKITEKGAVKSILKKSIKDITESEADTLATKLAPITDKKVVQSEVENFLKQKAGVVPEVVKPAIPKELEPLAEEARKYKSAEEFVKNLGGVFEKRLPDLRESFAELVRVTTRAEGVRGASQKTKYAALDAFEATGRQLIREVSSALGYKDLQDMPESLRLQIKHRLDQFGFDPSASPEDYIRLIDTRLRDITFDKELRRGKSLTDIYNLATKVAKEVKPEVKAIPKPQEITPKTTEVPATKAATEPPIPPAEPPKPPIEPPTPPSGEVPPSPENTIQKLNQVLKEAKTLRGQQEKIYSAERAQKLAKMKEMSKGVEGEEGYIARLAALKGEMEKVDFESVADKFSKQERDTLFNQIWQNPHLSEWEKVNAGEGLTKLLGIEGGRVPTLSELEKLSYVFPEDVIRTILNKRGFGAKLTDVLMQTYNLPRQAMAGFLDLSATILQNVLYAFRAPITTARNLENAIKAFGSENFSQFVKESIKNRENFTLYKKAGIQLTEMSPIIRMREEAFMAPLLERVPILGPIFKATGRAWTDFLNLMRADIADKMIETAKLTGQNVTDEKFLKDLGYWVNAATGRGDLGKLERIAPILGQGLFSSRKLAATVQLLNPAFYIKANPIVRREALKTWLAYMGGGLTLLVLAKMAGAEVETDPTSADFGKIKIGNTRFNIWGTNQQLAVLFSRLWKGYMTSSTTGNIVEFGEGYKPLTRLDLLKNFFETKEHPTLSLIMGLISGTDQLGRPFQWKPELVSRFIPMVIGDTYDLYKEHGPIGLLGTIPLVLGVPTQTYGAVELKEGIGPLGEPTVEVEPTRKIEDVIAGFLGKEALAPTTQSNAELFYRKMLKMPKEQAAELFDMIIEKNPDLARKINRVHDDYQRGITKEDQLIRNKGVANGERAKYLVKKFNELEGMDEKAKLWDEYVNKGIITPEVAKQLYVLLGQKQNVVYNP